MNALKVAAIVAMAATPAYADIYIRPHMKKDIHSPSYQLSAMARKHIRECNKHPSTIGVTLCHYDID
jgi:hypothetical protein